MSRRKASELKDTARFLPTTLREAVGRGWSSVEVLLVTPDPYIGHSGFRAAALGRHLESRGWRLGILPQPDWRDPQCFAALGRPALWIGISGGTVDSLLATYTVNRKKRRSDLFGPEGRDSRHPARAVTAYANVLRRLFPGVPIAAGGIEACTRRFAHVDWRDGKVYERA